MRKAAEEAAQNFEREKFDLIYAVTTAVVTAAKAVTTNMPVVFCVGDRSCRHGTRR